MVDKKRGRIYVRLSKQEESQYRSEASQMGITLSDYIRNALAAYRASQTPQG